jgi:hypothetical protein
VLTKTYLEENSMGRKDEKKERKKEKTITAKQR